MTASRGWLPQFDLWGGFEYIIILKMFYLDILDFNSDPDSSL